MDSILKYLNALPVDQRDEFARKCGTTVGYLRKAVSAKQRIGLPIAIKLEQESGGEIRCDDIRDDLDWTFLRGKRASRKAATRA